MNRIRKFPDKHLITLGWLPLRNILLTARAGFLHPRNLNLTKTILLGSRSHAASQFRLTARRPAILSLCKASLFRSGIRPVIGAFGRLLGSLLGPLLRLKVSVGHCCTLAVVFHLGL